MTRSTRPFTAELQLLLAHGLQGLMPLPQPLPQRIRDDVKPRPVLTLDAAMLADEIGRAHV